MMNKAEKSTENETKITEEVVLQIAHLARLKPNLAIKQELNKIVKMVDHIASADTQNILPMAHPLDMPEPFRPDIVTEPDVRDEMLKLSQKTESGLFLVPAVLED